MPEKSNYRLYSTIIFSIFIFYTFWWLYLQMSNAKVTSLADYFTDSYGVIAGVGGVIGIIVAKKWGGFKSLLGRSLTLFSIGLLFQFLGQICYAIYFYVYHIDNPYPSFGEVFYFGSIPIYIYAIWLLGKVSGSKISLKLFRNKLWLVGLPVAMMFASFFMFLQGYEFDWTSPITVLLDFGYPFGQAIFVSLALSAYIMTKKTLGGVMRNKVVFVLFALVVQYIADTVFLYRTLQDTWYAGGLSDFLFLISYFLMSVSLLKFGYALKEVKKT